MSVLVLLLLQPAVTAQSVGALVCGMTPDTPGLVERTIAGQQPMGGDFDVVVIGTVVNVRQVPDAEGYRHAAIAVGAVLRGHAERELEVRYPAAADDTGAFMAEGETYLIVGESERELRHVTISPCSATQPIEPDDDPAAWLARAPQLMIYDESLAPASDGASQGIGTVWIAVAAVLLVLLGSSAAFGRRPGHRPD